MVWRYRRAFPDTDAVRAELWAWLAEHFTLKVVEAAERQTQGLARGAPRLEPEAQGEFRSKRLGSDVMEVLHGEVGDVPPGHTTWDCY